uniref:Uncharacterized protein n=1 Tax=Rousettus aegyptiacus TaxID=9407 RepID=A0A7J8E9B9_ROUAE|nr:hypothetical protein HJG63_008239 [Rousettus aegyptiacus]
MRPGTLLLLICTPTAKWCLSLCTRRLSDLKRTYVQATAAAETTPKPSRKDRVVHDGIKSLASAWGDVPQECRNGIWTETRKRFAHDVKGFAEEEEEEVRRQTAFPGGGAGGGPQGVPGEGPWGTA